MRSAPLVQLSLNDGRALHPCAKRSVQAVVDAVCDRVQQSDVHSLETNGMPTKFSSRLTGNSIIYGVRSINT